MAYFRKIVNLFKRKNTKEIDMQKIVKEEKEEAQQDVEIEIKEEIKKDSKVNELGEDKLETQKEIDGDIEIAVQTEVAEIKKEVQPKLEIEKNSEIEVQEKEETKPEVQEEIKTEAKKSSNRNGRTKFQKGLESYNRRDFSKATKYFEKSIEENDSDCIKSMYFIGKIHMTVANKMTGKLREEEYKKAEQQFKRCIDQTGEDLYSILELGKLYLKQGNTKKAYKEFQRYIQINKDATSIGRLWLGKLYISAGEYEKAEIELEKGIELEKNKGTQCARLELGRLYVREEKYEEAEIKFRECLEFNKKDVYAKESLKELLKFCNKGKEKESTNLFEKQESENPKLQYLDEMRIRQKIYLKTITEDDIKKIKELIEERKEQKENYLVLIAIYERIGQKQNALNIIRQMQQNGLEVKGLAQVKERLNSKKARIYDMAKWDELIGWNVTQIENENGSKQNYELQVEKKDQKDSITEKTQYIQTQENKTNYKLDKVVKIKETKKKTQYIIQEGVKQKSNSTQKSPKEKRVKENDENREKRKIRDIVGVGVKEVTDRIGQTYYVQMRLYNGGTLNTCAEKIERRQKYIKKYDKLQSILECSENNKRAKMELMLVLMNEGYSKVVENEFPREYEYINKLVEEYKKKTKTAKEVRQEIDEYCL